MNDVVGQLARLVLSGPQKTPVEEYRKSIAALEERKEQLESQIGRRSAEFRAASVPVTLEAVQAAMPADAALIEFAAYRPFDPAIDSVTAAFGKLRYAAYVVHRSGPPSGVDLGDAETIDKAVEALRGSAWAIRRAATCGACRARSTMPSCARCAASWATARTC